MRRDEYGSPRWWKEDAESVHSAVFAMAREMEEEQQERRQENDLMRRLYGAKMPSASLYGIGAPQLGPDGTSCWTYNLVRTAVDVLGAKVAKSKPKASFVTNGGTWAEQRRARGLDKFVYGTMFASDCYRTLRRVFRDAAVCDLGVVMGWVDNGKVCLERVDPDEIQVDMADGYNGKPRTLLRSYVVSRDTAHGWVEAWNKGRPLELRERMHRDVNAAATAMSDRANGERKASFGDVVQVQEAWHLPSSPRAQDGRHVLALSTLTLLDETKDAPDFFPFAFCRLEAPFQGFYGQGVAQALVKQQRAINLTLRRISSIIENAAVLYLHFDNASKASQEQGISGEGVKTFRGANPPQQVVGNPVPPALWQMADYAIERGLESVGLNTNAPAAEKPAGLNSGVALREYEDIQSDRLSTYHLAFEECVVDVARLVVRLATQAARQKEALTAYFPRGQRSEAVKWSAVQADEDSFVLQCYSTSSLPATPAARKQYVEELWEGGQIDSAEYRRLLEIPDVEASDNLALAARNVVDMALDRMLDGDTDEVDESDYTPPEPFDDLAYALKRSTLVYAKARLDGAPEGRLELVRRYILQVTGLLQTAAQAAPPAPVGNLRAPDAAAPSAVPATPAAPPMAA